MQRTVWPTWLLAGVVGGVALVTMLALGACAPDRSSVPTSYDGVRLPAAKPMDADVPPAWLIAGGQAIAAAVAAFTWDGAHADPAYAIPDLAIAATHADKPAVILVAARQVEAFQVTVRPWSKDGRIVPLFDESARELLVTSRSDGKVPDTTVLTVTPTSYATDQLMRAHIKFGKGEAFYVWRLTAAP